MKMEEVKERFAKIEEKLKEAECLQTNESENTSQMKSIKMKAAGELFELKEYFHKLAGKCDEDRFHDVFVDFVMSIPNGYDSRKGKLEHYVNTIWARRKNDIFAHGGRKNDVLSAGHSESDDEKEDNKSITRISLESEWIEEATTGDISSEQERKVELEDTTNSILLEVAVAIGKMFEHYTKQNNPIREKYFRLIYTDRMTRIVKEGDLTSEQVRHERQIMNSCNLQFLDFYMREICRSITAVNLSELKKGCEIGDMETNEKILELPLQERVYKEYFRQFENKDVSSSLLSQNKANFDKMLHTLEILN